MHGVRSVSVAVVLVLLRAGAEDLVVSAAEDLAAPVGFDRPGGRRLLVRFQQIQTRLALFAHRADLLSRHIYTDERWKTAARTT